MISLNSLSRKDDFRKLRPILPKSLIARFNFNILPIPLFCLLRYFLIQSINIIYLLDNHKSIMNENKRFSKILVPIDGSEHSFHASQVALNIAEKFNAKVICLYVIVSPSPQEYVNLTGLVTPKQIERIIDNAKEESKDWFERIKNSAKEDKMQIDIRTEVILTGLAAYGEIIQFAEKEKIDLIVIGTRGRTGFKKVLLGSVASGVVTYAHCPVMVVK